MLAQGTGYMARFEEGHPIGYFWGYKTAGPIQNEQELKEYISSLKDQDPANSHQGSGLKVGDLRFVDTNGDGIVNDADKTDLGNPNPDVTMGTLWVLHIRASISTLLVMLHWVSRWLALTVSLLMVSMRLYYRGI